MSTAYEQVSTGGSVPVADTPVPATAAPVVGGGGVAFLGLLTVLISAWGGIVPYVGPTFGYSADGMGSWHWNLAQALLALVPGAVGVVAGLSMMTSSGRVRYGVGRLGLGTAGFLATLCGAWFVIGPSAWAVLVSSHHYFVPASPLRGLANAVGYAYGPGLLLAMFGAYAIGWAIRHRSMLVAAVPLVGPARGRHLSAVDSPAGTTPVVVQEPPQVL